MPTMVEKIGTYLNCETAMAIARDMILMGQAKVIRYPPSEDGSHTLYKEVEVDEEVPE